MFEFSWQGGALVNWSNNTFDCRPLPSLGNPTLTKNTPNIFYVPTPGPTSGHASVGLQDGQDQYHNNRQKIFSPDFPSLCCSSATTLHLRPLLCHASLSAAEKFPGFLFLIYYLRTQYSTHS